MNGLRLKIATPREVLVERAEIRSLRAEDESGSFGILRGHADFLTVLGSSVVRWRGRDDAEHFCAVRNGILTVRGGAEISIACREGVLGDDLARLEAEVRAMREAELDAARRTQVEHTRLHARAVRQLMCHLLEARGETPFAQGDLGSEDLP